MVIWNRLRCAKSIHRVFLDLRLGVLKMLRSNNNIFFHNASFHPFITQKINIYLFEKIARPRPRPLPPPRLWFWPRPWLLGKVFLLFRTVELKTKQFKSISARILKYEYLFCCGKNRSKDNSLSGLMWKVSPAYIKIIERTNIIEQNNTNLENMRLLEPLPTIL